MDMAILTALVATVPDQTGVRAAARALAEARSADAATIKGRGAGQRLEDGTIIGAAAVLRADEQLAKSTDQHELEELAWHAFNWLREARPTPPIIRPGARSKLDLVTAVPAFADVEIAWRAMSKDATLVTYLTYWDAQQPIDLTADLWTRVLDELEAAGIGLTPEMRAQLLAACTFERAGPLQSELDRAGIPDATIDDVRAVLAEAGV